MIAQIKNKITQIKNLYNQDYCNSCQRSQFVTGFTLVEILIALLIFGVGIVGIVALFPVGLDATKKSVTISTATILAQRKLEEIKTQGFASAANSNGDFTDFLGYSWDAKITDHAVPNLKVVTLIITWKSHGKTKTDTFVTYLAKYAP